MGLIFLLTLLVLFVAGLVTTLFISHAGWGLSIVAFLAFAIASLLKGNVDKLVPSQDSGMSLDLLQRLRTYIRWAVPILGLLFLLCLVGVFSQWGVCDTDSLPVFARREHYVLVNHGTRTVVSPLRYFLAGISFTIGWHSLPLLIILSLFDQFIGKEISLRTS